MEKENIYELMYLSHMGDERAFNTFLLSFENLLSCLVDTCIKSNPLMVIYRDDLIQEARCALYDAYETYREDRDTSFYTFATLVVKRHIWKVLARYNSKINVQIHDTLSFDSSAYNGDWYEHIPAQDGMSNPQYYTHYHVAEENLNNVTKKLNKKDREVIYAWLNSSCYEEAKDMLGISYKSYAGRLTRVRNKIKKAIHKYDD